ncbi:MAG: transposase [Clostridia bacterium]|nr:transposase [Clostridia bacterium]
MENEEVERVERIEIHLKEALLISGPLKDTFSFKEEVITLQEVELSSNLGSSPKSGPLFRVILTKRLDFRIEKEKSYPSEVDVQVTHLEEKSLSFEGVDSQGSIEITVGLDEFREILPSGFLAILSSFAESVGFFNPFLEHFSLPMKEVSYSTIDKIATLFSSIVVGCSHIKDINHKLTPYPSAASLFKMKRFPDQSGINRFLNKMGPEEISELSLIFEAIVDKVALFQDKEKVDLNVDATGLTVYGDRYQFARKGYFPKKRGRKGYQLSLGTTNSEYSQILSLILDPGNISLAARLWDTIYEVAEVLGSLERIGTVRADAIYGIGPDIALLTRHNLSFFVKGNSSSTAKRILRELDPSYDDWRRVDETTWAFDTKYLTIRRCPYPVRTVLIKAIDAKGKIDYRHIYTSFSPKDMDEVEVAISFRKRTDIESIIRDDKYGLHIDNLRTKNFYGIWAYLFIACATHNLISLFRKKVLFGTGIEDLGIQTITNKLTDIPAKFEKEQQRMRILFPAGHELARRFIQGKQDNHKGSIFPLEKKLYN